DIDPTRPEMFLRLVVRHREHLRLARLRSIVPELGPGDPSWITGHGSPHGIINRAHDDTVAARIDARVELRIVLAERAAAAALVLRAPAADRLVPRLGDLPVAVGIEHRGTPAGRELLILRLFPDLHVDPRDGRTAATEVQHVLFVAELQMVRAEARVDQLELAGLRIVDRRVPEA